MATPDRVVLVDGSAMIFRAFFAIPPNFTTATGLHTNAIYGFTLMFKKLFAGRTPVFGAVVFDAPGRTFRDDKYAGYKADRVGMPPELVEQLQWIDRVVEVHNFPILRVAGYEADDVIGTLAKEAEAAGKEVHIVSGDKDFAQLITDQVKMLDTIRDITYDPELVRKKWGVPPAKFVDYQALVGDKIDNIPGVPGIGHKGAAELLEKYGTLDGVLQAIPELKGRQQKALMEGMDSARLSHELATIDVRVPLDVHVEDLRIERPDQPTLNSLYKELEFYSLLEQEDIAGEFLQGAQDFRTLTDAADIGALLDTVSADDALAVMAMFDDPHPVHGAFVGLALSAAAGSAAFVPFSAPAGSDQPLVDEEGRALLARFLADVQKPKVAHNAKWVAVALGQVGMRLEGVVLDTMLASFLIDPTKLIPHVLTKVAKEYLHRTLPPQKSVTGAGKTELRLSQVPTPDVALYACHLVEAVKAMAPLLRRRLEAEGQVRNFVEVDLPLSFVLGEMEQHGIYADKDDLRRMGVEFQEKLDRISERIYEMAGRRFNIGSTKQLSEVLFDEMKLPVIKKNKSGYSTDAEVLQRLADKGHAICELLLEHRTLAKLINTYTDVLQNAVHPRTGRIHASFQQTVSSTGRLITTEPDLQRTPVNTPEGMRIRKSFTAPPGTRMVSADWSQIELRILAHVSEDARLIEAFTEDLDVHRRTAGQIFRCSPGEVTPKQRGVGKTVNFATIYGQGATALSQQLKVARKEAQGYIDAYFEYYAGVRRWLDGTIARAHEDGYVETLLGRRRYLPELSSSSFMERTAGERIAANTPIQGSAADICKLAMLAIAKDLRAEGLRSRMLLQVHDELVFEAPEAEVERLISLVRRRMESAVPLRVPLVVDIGAGADWGSAKA